MSSVPDGLPRTPNRRPRLARQPDRLAILLIGVLTAALVGPYVIDWNSHRALIERRLSEAAGTPVTVAGPIDLKILPTPRLRFGKVAIGDARAGRPRLTADALEAELSLTALTRGQVQVVDTTLVRPHLDIAQAPDGTVDLALPTGTAADRFAVDHLGVEDGTVVLTLADGRRETLSGLDLDGEGDEPARPLQGDGPHRRPPLPHRHRGARPWRAAGEAPPRRRRPAPDPRPRRDGGGARTRGPARHFRPGLRRHRGAGGPTAARRHARHRALEPEGPCLGRS